MTREALIARYRAYIDCLNRQDWQNLGKFVAETVTHNGRPFGLSGYRHMLETDYETIPDLRFVIALLVVDPPLLAARLAFDCTPKGEFLGLPVNGRRISFAEHVIYEWAEGKIVQVWSVIDKAGIEGQLGL